MARAMFLNTILSGKLGGTVYARNKAGYYVRQFSKPTNPNTIAQADARDEFAASTTSWHLLQDAQKAFWNTYATGDFKPKNPVPGVLYSGFNAFVSLWNAAKNANRKSRIYTLKGNGANPLTYTETEFSLSLSPPTGVFSGNIKDHELNPLSVSLMSAALAIDGKARVNISFFASPGPQDDAPVFVEPNTSLPVGYVLFASNVIGQGVHFVTKPNQTIIGVAKPPAEITGWVLGDWFLEIEFGTEDTSIDQHKLWYDIGDICRMELWAVGSTGPLFRIGERIVTVIETLPGP